MGTFVLLKEQKGFRLLREDVTDEYLRLLRKAYIVSSPNGKRMGVFSSEEKAMVVFERAVADAD